MLCSGVRGCTGTFLSALHSLVRWTPAHELLQASAAETRPIPESIQSIGGFEHAGIRAATLSAGIHEKFGHFASPFLFGAPSSGAPRFRHDTGRALQTERHSKNHAPADAGTRSQVMEEGRRTGGRGLGTRCKCPAVQESLENCRRADGARIPRQR